MHCSSFESRSMKRALLGDTGGHSISWRRVAMLYPGYLHADVRQSPCISQEFRMHQSVQPSAVEFCDKYAAIRTYCLAQCLLSWVQTA